MPRDFEPPVRERDIAPPARRSTRRDTPPEPDLIPEDPALPVTRVARDEHRPRRGTLPDRRMLRRDPLPDGPVQLGPDPESAEPEQHSNPETPAGPVARNREELAVTAAESRPEPEVVAPEPEPDTWSRAGLGGVADSAVPELFSEPEPELSAEEMQDRARSTEALRSSASWSLGRRKKLPSLEPEPYSGPETVSRTEIGMSEGANASAANTAGGPESADGSKQSERERAPRAAEGMRPRGSDRVEGERMDEDHTRGLAGSETAATLEAETAGRERTPGFDSGEAAVSARRSRGTEGATAEGSAHGTESDPAIRRRETPPGREVARRADTGDRTADPAGREHRRAAGPEREGRRGEGRDAPRGGGTEGPRGRGRESSPADGRDIAGDGHERGHREGYDATRGDGREPGRRRADGRDASQGREIPRGDGRAAARGEIRGERGEVREGRGERDGRGEVRDGRGERDGRAEAREGARDPQRAAGSDARTGEGRKRPTDPDRVHLGGRTGSPGRTRRPRPDGEPGERTGRDRRGRTERGAAEAQGRGSAGKGKGETRSERAERTKAAKSAAAKRRAAAKKKQKQAGPKLLDDSTRAKLEVITREQNGLGALWATFRLHTDDLRRRNFAARAERMEYGSFDEFDRTTQQLTDRGYIGAGGGRMNVVGRPVEYRATTAQVAGLWPWSVGAGAPLIGTPLGSHLHTGAPVCFDPMNWFMRGSFITAPSLFVLGLNGFGKSSLVRRIVLGGVAQGITPLILADVKPDYRKLVELVGGQVIDLGYGHGKLNPLAAGVLGSIVPMLTELPALHTQVMQELRARQVTLVAGLVELVRGARVRDYEETLLATALRILYRPGSAFTPDKPPIIEDLLTVIVAGGDELQLDAGADNPDEYQNAIKGLRRSLRALTQGPFGAVFNGQTTTPIDTTATAVCIDVSHIPSGDKKLKAAVMLACWADGFASVEAAHVLADADLGPQRYFQVVMDELWQVLGLGDFMVDRVDELTRLQRGIATSLIMISHTIKDLQALGSEAAIAKALGFLERARAKIFGALPAEEIARLDSTVPFTSAEEDMVTSWSAPQALTGEALKPGQQRPPAPGTGKFLLKIGEDRRPGIPFHMEFTWSERESGIHDTNQRFSEFTESTARRGTDDGSVTE
ncbi:hypothetical protein AB0L82_07435 [Nocardia sp. NPDC052001]|uniref:hypothetical protein n=1 Tax=Nocardia sp. NPDC052001 TaxID=3154853 RepID=UPI0034380761